MKEQAIRSKLKLKSKYNKEYIANINEKNSNMFDVSWIMIGYVSTLIFFLITLVIYFKCIKESSYIENKGSSSLTSGLINELNNHDHEAIILE